MSKKTNNKSTKNEEEYGILVFEKDTCYIMLDYDCHNGGVWKVFDRYEDRLGVWNQDLTEKVDQ